MSAKKNILLCCTGSVACTRILPLVTSLTENESYEVRLVMTQNSLHFFENLDWFTSRGVKVFKSGDEWLCWNKKGDPVLHIDLVKWADALVIVPLNANTLAKVAAGICDNLVTCVARAWDFASNKPFIFCPAMNTSMWDHPITSRQVDILKSWGCVEVAPIVRMLACGVVGMGCMAEPETIADFIGVKLGS